MSDAHEEQGRRLLHLHDDANRLLDLTAFAEAAWEGVFLKREQEERVQQGYAYLLANISDVAKDMADRIREVRGLLLDGAEAGS